MEIRQLRYFYTIANEGQVTQAAKKLHMAQPPLSQSLKSLEDELCVTLLERNGRKMELTEAGMVLYNQANKLFNLLDETEMEVKETGEGIKGTLSVGCVKSCFSFMPNSIKKFREEYPNVTFELREGDSYMLAEQLKNRDIDLAVIRLPLETKFFSLLPLPEEKYVAVIPENYQTISANSIAIKELSEIPLMLLHRISGIGQYETILEQFKKKQLKPDIVCECPDVDMLLKLVSEGIGATIIPESALSKYPIKGMKVLNIQENNIISESAVIWLKDRYLSKSAERFISLFEMERTEMQAT